MGINCVHYIFLFKLAIKLLISIALPGVLESGAFVRSLSFFSLVAHIF